MTRLKELMSLNEAEESAHIDCDLTLFIRLLEIAREELKSDAELHYLVERCSKRYAEKGKQLTMDDYEVLWPKETKE